jgi:BAG domain
MTRVEQYDGLNRKEYAFLDEMLTQNLLKLDDIDAEGKENIKNARREAIKCINSLISLLEAKKDEAQKSDRASSESKTTAQCESAKAGQTPPTQNGLNGASKNSSYDNVNSVKQTSSNNSVNMSQDVSAESSLEAKVQAALQSQK